MKASIYNFKESTKENLTLETVLFLSHCLQHNEDDRKCITELIEHLYVNTPFEEQRRISPENFNQIFGSSPSQLNKGSKEKKRPISATPKIRATRSLGMQFNAKDNS